MKARVIGKRLQRPDAVEKVTGRALFPGDLSMRAMLHAQLLWSDRAHARILAVDTSRAERVPGVVAIMTHLDVPVNEYGLACKDQPALAGDRVRTVFDRVALIIAENQRIARTARDLIRVEYEDLAVITDPRDALAPGAPIIHDMWPDNIQSWRRVRKGDVDAIFAQSDLITVEAEYSTPHQEHAFLQPEAGLGFIDDQERVTVHSAGQCLHDDLAQIAHMLDLPPERIRVIYTHAGGAFGGREDLSLQHLLPLAVYYLERRGISRPVKMVWDRHESFRGHPKRHPFRMHCRTAATQAGELAAVEATLVTDIGAYSSSSSEVLDTAVTMVTGPYEVPNVKIDACNVFTNNLVSGAMRGFGALQATFAAESQMARLAHCLNMDPVIFRLRNTLREGSMMTTQSVVPAGVSIRETLTYAAEAAGWTREGRPSLPEGSSTHLLHGIGVASGYKNVCYGLGFPERCSARCELYGQASVEKAVIKMGVAEAGQGTLGAMGQIAAETLGIPHDRVLVVNQDTLEVPEAGSASASRLSFIGGHAVRLACKSALQAFAAGENPAIAEETFRPRQTSMYDAETGACDPFVTFGYGTQIAHVEVNADTGEIKLRNVFAAHDVGRAINPLQIEGQIQGSISQALGWTLLEDFVLQEGQLRTKSYAGYLIPTVYDMPDQIQTLILEIGDPQGPYGVRGVGEMPILQLAPAICDAIHDATGIWFDRLPIRAEDVLLRLEGMRRGKG